MGRKWHFSSETMAIAISSATDQNGVFIHFQVWGCSPTANSPGYRCDEAQLRRAWAKAVETAVILGSRTFEVDDNGPALHGEFGVEFQRIRRAAESAGFVVRLRQIRPSALATRSGDAMVDEVAAKERGWLRVHRVIKQMERLLFRSVLLIAMTITSVAFVAEKVETFLNPPRLQARHENANLLIEAPDLSPREREALQKKLEQALQEIRAGR